MGAIRIGAVIARKYQLEAPLARGGMGSVWAARHVSLGRRLAVKFISPEVAGRQDVRSRFDREARAAASLQSPNIVQIHDYGIDDDVPYLVMELLDGEDLGARLATRGRLPVADTVNLVRQVARALRRLGEAGIVHRDLKPSNLFITRGDEDEEVVKVLDFGIAKVPRLGTGDATRNGVMIGSPRYMSPEQAQGSPLVDHRSDLWSLAVIAYRAITGRMPFQGVDVAALMISVCNDAPLPPSEIDHALGPALDAFFVKALARSADDRFQSARDLVAALELAAGETLSSGTSSLPPEPRGSLPTRQLTLSPAPAIARPIAVTRPSVSPEPAPAPPPVHGRSEVSTLPEPSVRRSLLPPAPVEPVVTPASPVEVEATPRASVEVEVTLRASVELGMAARPPLLSSTVEDTPRTTSAACLDVPTRARLRASARSPLRVGVTAAMVAALGVAWAIARASGSLGTAASSPAPPATASVEEAAFTVPAPRSMAPPMTSSSSIPAPKKRAWPRAHPILGF